MSLKPVYQSINNAVSQLPAASPDYAGLVRFLVQPFLDSPTALSVDCEISLNTARVWLRVAFESEDKGKVFGRGGRNIQAIRTVIAAAAVAARHSVYLDIYGSQSQEREGMSDSEEEREPVSPPKSPEPRSTIPKPVAKPRPPSSVN